MKALLLVTLVMVLGHGAAERCSKRQDLVAMPRGNEVPLCNKPQQVPVQLPVPDDYDHVEPSVVMLNQCTGLASIFPQKCFPTPDSITNKTYKVNAYRADDHTPHCEEVQVEEHGACESRCEDNCQDNTILNEISCECMCDLGEMYECDAKQRTGMKVMWSSKACSCKCDNIQECDSSMIWVEEECRCAFRNELDISSEI